ncbi:MAG: response regulator [Bacteroidales bacterium]|nr:response regulator [Bacteroidales bacterium]
MNKPDFSTYRLLIAEDNKENFLFYKSSLKPTGIQIIHAENGQRAVKQFKDHEIDLVIMDAMMPVMDGFKATEAIKKMKPEIPVIILTAYVNQETIREAVASGSNDYLSKPITPDVLYVALQKWLPGY